MIIMLEMKDKSLRDCQCRKELHYALPVVGVLVGLTVLTTVSIIRTKKTFKSLFMSNLNKTY